MPKNSVCDKIITEPTIHREDEDHIVISQETEKDVFHTITLKLKDKNQKTFVYRSMNYRTGEYKDFVYSLD